MTSLEAMMMQTAHKWVPVIDRDSCTGCGLCVSACERRCLGLVWDFATFQNSDECGSCGHCAEACRSDVIHMGWVKTTGNPAQGRWCAEPETPAAPAPAPNWLWGLFR